MKRQIKEAAERKRRENETRFQRFKRTGKSMISGAWERLQAFGAWSKTTAIFVGQKIKQAWDWHWDKVSESGLYSLICLLLTLSVFGTAIISIGVQRHTPYDIFDERPTNSIVIAGDQCWLLYDQEVSEGQSYIDFEVGEQFVNVKGDFQNSRFKGTDWKQALERMGHSDLDPSTCVKHGKVFE